MDPVTQGLLGAAAAQPIFGKKLNAAWLLGAAGGMAADLDVLIRSETDPLLAIEYHRHFTHSLAFIPIGGLLVALPFFVRRGYRKQWKAVVGATTVGYATHGLLDACTTYGTQLLWPFSNVRVAWDTVSIVDPVFTLALLIGLVWSVVRNVRGPVLAALAFALLYLALGAVQRDRALAAQEQIALTRNHPPRVRGEVFPTLANQWVWRSLYEADGRLYVDRIRIPWFGSAQWSEGSSVPLLTGKELPPWVRNRERTMRDFERFRWFSSGWVARALDDPSVMGDVRYSLRTDAFDPIWGIRFHPDRQVPTEWVDRTSDRSLKLSDLWAEINGTDPRYQPLPPP